MLPPPRHAHPLPNHQMNRNDRITDRDRIAETLRAYMLAPKKQRAPFLMEIKQCGGADWNGRDVGPGGHIIEGARPMSAFTGPDGNTVFSLTNSDSGYTTAIGAVKLDDIEYVTTL